ncbi:MAG: hypothetical protein CJBNEKGG_00367 [Prosthecobacter sp.]|nr:hypothetical protein [Prosthecobacter sp.]
MNASAEPEARKPLAGGETSAASENHRTTPPHPGYTFTAPWKGARSQRQSSATVMAESPPSRALPGRPLDSVILSRSRSGGSRSPSLASPPANLSRASGSTIWAFAFHTYLWLSIICSVHAAPLKVSGDFETITLSHAGKTEKLELPEEVGVDMDDAILLADQVRAEHRYLLLQVTGPSRRSGNGNGNCGAGVETSIVWLKLTNWKIAELKHRKVESCWTDEGFLEMPKWKDGICKVVFWAPRENNQEFTLTYDSGKPEKGFQLTSKPFN